MREKALWIVPALLVIVTTGCAAESTAGAPITSTTSLQALAAIPTTTTTTTSMATTTTLEPEGSTTTRVPVPPPTTTPPLPTTTTTPPDPVFEYTVSPVTEQTVAYSWHEECPLHWSELSLVTLTYWNFEGRAVKGKMVVNSAVVEDVVAAFEGLFEIHFPIQRIALVDEYWGDDKAAMAANITSGFNCRYVDGTERWSNHAFGLAIDINPLVNPWAREGNVLPVEGATYTDREDPIPGMINVGDRAVDIFTDLGWSWGGAWATPDYMHFSQPGN